MPRLIVVDKNSSVRQIDLSGPVTMIGRAENNKVKIGNARVSRHHAAIEWTGAAYVLTDLGSCNGTYVNGEKVRTRELRSGDAITVGDCHLRFLEDVASRWRATGLRLLTIPDQIRNLNAGWARPSAARHFPGAG